MFCLIDKILSLKWFNEKNYEFKCQPIYILMFIIWTMLISTSIYAQIHYSKSIKK
jgi:hypothetical protein